MCKIFIFDDDFAQDAVDALEQIGVADLLKRTP